jgi:type I restriction enzyme S subunit
MELEIGQKHTELGELPADWEVRPLGELGEALIGLTYTPAQVRDHGTLVLRSSNIQNSALVFEDNVFVDAPIPERLKVIPGDVLVCVRNGSRALIGKSVLLDGRALGMTFGAFMAVYRSPIGKFVSFVFQSPILKRQIDEHLGATINQITNKSLASFRIPLPPLEDERNAITSALSDIDALLDGLTRLIAKKRDLKQAAMQQLLTGRTRLPGFDAGWRAASLGEMARLSRSTVNPSSTPAELFTHFSLPSFDAGATPVIESGAAIGSNKFGVPQSAVLLSKLNPRIPRVWAPREIPLNAVCSTEFLVLLPRATVDRSFLRYVCLSPNVCSQMELHAIGTTGSHQRIQPTQAMRIEVSMPVDIAEQGAIATLLSDMDAELTALEARRAKTQALKQAMMQALLTGRIRLVSPEPAHA